MQRGLEELRRVSQRYYDRRWALGQRGRTPEEDHILDRAYWRILRAETSCNFYWGSSWVHRAFDDLERIFPRRGGGRSVWKLLIK